MGKVEFGLLHWHCIWALTHCCQCNLRLVDTVKTYLVFLLGININCWKWFTFGPTFHCLQTWKTIMIHKRQHTIIDKLQRYYTAHIYNTSWRIKNVTNFSTMLNCLWWNRPTPELVFIYVHQVAPSSNVTWPGTLRVNNAVWSAVELTVLYKMPTKGLS